MLSLATAYMYFHGYLYYAGFYGYFGVDPALFQRTTADYLVQAWDYPFMAATALLAVGSFIALFRDVGHTDWLVKLRAALPKVVWYMIGLVILVVLVGRLARAGHAGRVDAAATVASKSSPVRVESTALHLPSELYLASYSQGKYLLYHFPGGQTFSTIILDDDDISRLDYRKANDLPEALRSRE